MAEPLRSSDGAPEIGKTMEETPKVVEESGTPSMVGESKVERTEPEGSTSKVEEPGTEPQLAPSRVVEGTPVKSASTAIKTVEAVPDPAAPVTEVSPVLAQDSPAITPENATATSETPAATGVSKDLAVETKESIPAVSQLEASETTSTEAANSKAKFKASNLFQNLKKLSHSRHSSELPKQAQTLEVGASVEPTVVPETKTEPTLAPTKSGGLLGKIRKAVYTRSQSFSQGFASKPAVAPLAVPHPVIEDTPKNVEDLKVPPPTTAVDSAPSAEEPHVVAEVSTTTPPEPAKVEVPEPTTNSTLIADPPLSSAAPIEEAKDVLPGENDMPPTPEAAPATSADVPPVDVQDKSETTPLPDATPAPLITEPAPKVSVQEKPVLKKQKSTFFQKLVRRLQGKSTPEVKAAA